MTSSSDPWSESWSWSWSSKSCSRIGSCCSRIWSLCSHRNRMRGLCSHGNRRPGRWRWRRWTGQQWMSRVGSYTKDESRAPSPCPRRIRGAAISKQPGRFVHRGGSRVGAVGRSLYPLRPVDRPDREGYPGRRHVRIWEGSNGGRMGDSNGPTVQRSNGRHGWVDSGCPGKRDHYPCEQILFTAQPKESLFV